MFRPYLDGEIMLVPILCGVFIQCLKLVWYSAAGKRFAISRLMQTDGMPNLHSAVFSSLSTSIGIVYGFSSLIFSFIAVYGVIIIHDTMRLKGEKGKQVDIIKRIISSSDTYRDIADETELRELRFRPLDVMCGTALGVAGAFALL